MPTYGYPLPALRASRSHLRFRGAADLQSARPVSSRALLPPCCHWPERFHRSRRVIQHMNKPKHIPIRTCVACRTTGAKRGLLRVVRQPDGSVTYDPKGKMAGRGAYVCAQADCIALARKQKKLERSLKAAAIPESLFQELAMHSAIAGDEATSKGAGPASASRSAEGPAAAIARSKGGAAGLIAVAKIEERVKESGAGPQESEE